MSSYLDSTCCHVQSEELADKSPRSNSWDAGRDMGNPEVGSPTTMVLKLESRITEDILWSIFPIRQAYN